MRVNKLLDGNCYYLFLCTLYIHQLTHFLENKKIHRIFFCKYAFLSFFVNLEINTSEALKICEKS